MQLYQILSFTFQEISLSLYTLSFRATYIIFIFILSIQFSRNFVWKKLYFSTIQQQQLLLRDKNKITMIRELFQNPKPHIQCPFASLIQSSLTDCRVCRVIDLAWGEKRNFWIARSKCNTAPILKKLAVLLPFTRLSKSITGKGGGAAFALSSFARKFSMRLYALLDFIIIAANNRVHSQRPFNTSNYSLWICEEKTYIVGNHVCIHLSINTSLLEIDCEFYYCLGNTSCQALQLFI